MTDGSDENPELILIRAEIRALREEMSRPPEPWHRPVWLPSLHEGHIELPEKHYALMNRLRRWVDRRSNVRYTNGHALRQRRSALWLLITGLIRTVAWALLIGCVAAGMAHVTGFSWAKTLAASVPFVALISLYANFATDLGAAIASYAALVSADVHTQVTVTGSELAVDIAAVQADVDRLAGMPPGEEAVALAASVKTRLAQRP